MERRKFIKTCCYSAIGIPVLSSMMQSCGAIHYANSLTDKTKLVIAKSEFLKVKKGKTSIRPFVLVQPKQSEFPICLYNLKDDNYIASLMECTHRGCELNVGGGIYSCPCHGSEFSVEGKVLEGPAERDLKTYKTQSDDKNVYIYLS